MEVSFVSLLSCNQLGLWDEQWGAGHPTPTPPTLAHQGLRVKWDEQWGGGHPTPPTLGHQELRIKWDELVHIMNKNIILQCQCSIFKCGTWWSAVHCTIGYLKMQVSTLPHGLWPFFTADPSFTKLIFYPVHFIKVVAPLTPWGHFPTSLLSIV